MMPALLRAALVACLAPMALGAPRSEPAATSVRGIAGAIEFTAPGPAIRARANQSLTSPMIVRVASQHAAEAGTTAYRVEFIGMIAGDFDIRGYLEHQDGTPLEIPPLVVHVVSQLPENAGTDLFATADTPLLTSSRYRVIMYTIGAAWIGVPLVYVGVKRARRRRVEPAPPAPPPPTLADQLRPLVEAAIAGSLSVAERGRLELLMYLYWRGRLGLEGPQARVVPALRQNPEAGALLLAVERWLHAARTPADRADADVASLLEPYRGIPAISGASPGVHP